MSVRSFLDTNVVIYAFDQLSPAKCEVARRLITDGAVSKQTFISYQVVQEFVNVALRGFKITVSRWDLETFMVGALFPMMAVSSSPALMIEALRLQAADNISWYDALIVAAALQARCQLLLSEDLQHGRRFGALTVSNPFKA
jgi:predicted nucleic acid-binding protein